MEYGQKSEALFITFQQTTMLLLTVVGEKNTPSTVDGSCWTSANNKKDTLHSHRIQYCFDHHFLWSRETDK